MVGSAQIRIHTTARTGQIIKTSVLSGKIRMMTDRWNNKGNAEKCKNCICFRADDVRGWYCSDENNEMFGKWVDWDAVCDRYTPVEMENK